MKAPEHKMPLYYDYQNANMSQLQPGTIHCHDNQLRMFFQRYFLQKALSVYKWKLPETWEENYFLYTLFLMGYIAIVKTDKFGVIPQGCGLYGYNVMYQPTHAIISNPLLKGNIRPKINKECAILRLQPDYGGIYDITSYYADLMACASESTTVNLINTKFSYVFFADGKSQAETFKKLFDNFSAGQPATVVDKNILDENGNPKWQLFTQNVQQAYIADKNLAVMRRINEMFDTDIGIPNTNEDKRERMLTDEVNANNIETFSKVSLWLEQLQKGCKIANEMFGIDISVDWRTYDKKIVFPIKPDARVGD